MTVYTSDSNPYSTHDVFADSAVISNGVVVFRIDSEILENVKFVDRGDYVSLDSDGSVAGYGISYEDGFIKFDSVDDVNYPLYGKYPGLKATYYSITNLKYRDEDADVDDEDSIVVVEPGDVDKDIKIVPYSDDDDVLVFAKDSDDDTISLELAEDELIIYDSRRSWAGMIGVTVESEPGPQYAVPCDDIQGGWYNTWSPIGYNKYSRINREEPAFSNDAQYISVGLGAGEDSIAVCSFLLNPLKDPGVNTGHVLIIRGYLYGRVESTSELYLYSDSGFIAARTFYNPPHLRDGTEIWLRNTWGTFYRTLTPEEAASITDYSKLAFYIQLSINTLEYASAFFGISYLALKVPGVE